MIRTIYRVGSIPTIDDEPMYQPMIGTVAYDDHVILDLIDTELDAEILGQWQYDGKRLIELVPLSEALLDHLPDTHEYDEEGNIIATNPPALHLPVELSGWPAYTEAVQIDIETAKEEAKRRINQAYDRATDALAAEYPYRERESWHVQVSEAKALTEDEFAETPWIDAAAAARGLDSTDLASRILANDLLYRQMHGTASGVRQALIDAINEATSTEALDAIQWPED